MSFKSMGRRAGSVVGVVLYYAFAQYLPRTALPFGRLGRWVRGIAARLMFREAGRDINVDSRAYLGRGSGIRLGDRSGIGYRCELYGRITIGADVMMAPEVVILTRSHGHERIDIPMRQQGGTEAEVVIGDDVWIGTRVIILPGVRIGRGSILGSGSVITKNVAPFSIMGGVPARLIRVRTGGADAPETGGTVTAPGA